MINSAKRREQAFALKDRTTTIGAWISLHDDVEQALSRLIDGVSKTYAARWPVQLSAHARTATVAAHTTGSYQSGGWAVGVVSNALNVLPFVPEALEKVGYPLQAEDARRTLQLFPDNLDFEEFDSQAQCDAVNAIEKWPGYNKFLEGIETRMPSEWETCGTPPKILHFAASVPDALIWADIP